MTASGGPETREGKAFLRRTGPQEDLARYLETACRPLLGSEIYFDNEGNIFYWRWRDIPPEGLLPAQFVQISHLHPQADIYAPHTRYPDKSEMQIVPIQKDGGAVEAAIRAMDYILEGTRVRERNQVVAVKARTSDLLDLFATNFDQVTDEQLAQARAETYATLARVGFNPDRVVTAEKRRIGHWLPKGSFGHDSGGRRNELITLGALTAAYRRAIVRQRGLSQIERKYVSMREALRLEREFSREIFRDVAVRLRPSAMPAHSLFAKPDSPVKNLGPVLGLLRTLQFQLQQPHLKTYRTIGLEAARILKQIEDLLVAERRAEVNGQGLFSQTYGLLVAELDRHREIYPGEERGE